ncbi:MAG: hypothetical protein AVDCRST_MAG60-1143 [uncultured Nocardioides sp.]|uniref:Uncharacterized protein n=1 Tax=uncultured Nocardioides sp. TaxID=198441 RepID=A0A6J4NCH6_9ACTN|nr:MAG: hypothetical protein AVDCRST_MAG60-1143 [uncultured Nocardioides sp.]
MTSTPLEPDSEPELVPAGDPGMDPIDPDHQPGPPIPEADPERGRSSAAGPGEARPGEAVPGTGS